MKFQQMFPAERVFINYMQLRSAVKIFFQHWNLLCKSNSKNLRCSYSHVIRSKKMHPLIMLCHLMWMQKETLKSRWLYKYSVHLNSSGRYLSIRNHIEMNCSTKWRYPTSYQLSIHAWCHRYLIGLHTKTWNVTINLMLEFVFLMPWQTKYGVHLVWLQRYKLQHEVYFVFVAK